MSGVSTDIGLDIGVQIERLVATSDDQDLGELRTLTSRILTTAERAGIDSMVDVSEQLLEFLEHDKDMIGIMQAANELLGLRQRPNPGTEPQQHGNGPNQAF